MNISDLTDVFRHSLTPITQYYADNKCLSETTFYIYFSETDFYYIFDENAYEKHHAEAFDGLVKVVFETVAKVKGFLSLEATKYRNQELDVKSATVTCNWSNTESGLFYDIDFVEKSPLIVSFNATGGDNN